MKLRPSIRSLFALVALLLGAVVTTPAQGLPSAGP
jgi:hypothetical protein